MESSTMESAPQDPPSPGEEKESVPAGEDIVIAFDMIHVTPPQSAPDFIAQSPLANATGYVAVAVMARPLAPGNSRAGRRWPASE